MRRSFRGSACVRVDRERGGRAGGTRAARKMHRELEKSVLFKTGSCRRVKVCPSVKGRSRLKGYH